VMPIKNVALEADSGARVCVVSSTPEDLRVTDVFKHLDLNP
jgi:hypothetical protein